MKFGPDLVIYMLDTGEDVQEAEEETQGRKESRHLRTDSGWMMWGVGTGGLASKDRQSQTENGDAWDHTVTGERRPVNDSSKKGRGQPQRLQCEEAAWSLSLEKTFPSKTSQNKGAEKGLIFFRKHNVIFIPLSVTD